MKDKCIDEANDLFRVVCYFSCSRFVPLKKQRSNKSRWINKGIKEDLKLIYSYINDKLKVSNLIKSLKISEGTTTSDGNLIAEYLNYLNLVFSTNLNQKIPKFAKRTEKHVNLVWLKNSVNLRWRKRFKKMHSLLNFRANYQRGHSYVLYRKQINERLPTRIFTVLIICLYENYYWSAMIWVLFPYMYILYFNQTFKIESEYISKVAPLKHVCYSVS